MHISTSCFYLDTVASNVNTPILTRSHAARLAEAAKSLSELPFFPEEQRFPNLNIDLSEGLFQVPVTVQHPRPTFPSSDSDSSDSDSDYYPSHIDNFRMPNVYSSMLDDTVTYAKWKPCGNGMPGTMSCGKITVETLEAAKRDLRIFLTNNRKLAASDYALCCLNVWEDPRVSNWIDQNREKFSALSFDKLFIAVRDRVLEPDWQDSTFRKMRAVRMPDDLSTSASDLAVQLMVLNNLLQGTAQFQSEESLKMMLIDAIDSGL
ncbi:hypothetical protein F5879DRAFT_928152, partial [Lentinula edodes]